MMGLLKAANQMQSAKRKRPLDEGRFKVRPVGANKGREPLYS